MKNNASFGAPYSDLGAGPQEAYVYLTQPALFIGKKPRTRPDGGDGSYALLWDDAQVGGLSRVRGTGRRLINLLGLGWADACSDDRVNAI